MSLQSRINAPREEPAAEAHEYREPERVVERIDRGNGQGRPTRSPSSKSRVHHEVITRLGPRLFQGGGADDRELAERVGEAVAEALAHRQDAADAPGARAGHARDRGRHPRLRPARAVPARRVRHRGHGQRAAHDLHRARGKLTRTNAQFVDDAHLLRIIDKIVSRVGRRVDESSPMVDARLPDGSRVNAIIPPLARQRARR